MHVTRLQDTVRMVLDLKLLDASELHLEVDFYQEGNSCEEFAASEDMCEFSA